MIKRKGKLIITDSALPVSEAEIKAAIDHVSFPGEENFVKFYRQNNGGEPNKNIVSREFTASIRYFYSMKHKFHPLIDTLERINDFYKALPSVGKYFSKKIIFAEDNGGNQHCIDINNGRIYCVPLDTGPNLSSAETCIADSFGDLLRNLHLAENVL